MKKVLVYKSNLLPRSETFIKEQILGLRNWQALLVGMKKSVPGLDLGGLSILLLRDLKKSAWQRLRWSIARHFDLPPPGVVPRLKAENAQLVHIHFGTEATRFWPVAEALNLPVVITLHGFDINTYKEWWESGKGGRGMASYPRRLLRIAASDRVHFIAVSNAVRERAIAFGISPEKVLVRYIGVDTRTFAPGGAPVQERAPRILFVGRFVEKKGLEYLIRALPEIRKSVPLVELVVAGDGPLRNDYEKLAADLGCQVSFLGAIPPEQVKKQMDLARVFCLPSITARSGDAEGLPIVILEAQACGVPVVTSARGGATEGIVDGVTGFAHTEGDVHGLASRLIQVLIDNQLAGEFSAKARLHMEQNFDLNRCSRALENTYDQLARDA